MEFVLYWTGLVHAVVATYASWYCYYYTCDNWEQGITPINDEKCLVTAKDIHYKMILNSSSYLVYDFICYFFIVQAKGALATQTYIHHILGSLSFYLTLYTEGVPVVFGALSLSLEASSVFLNIRWFTFEFKIKNE